MHIQAAVTLAPQINERSRKMAESLDENSIARLTAPRRNFAHPPVKKPPKVSQADFDRRQRERNLKQRQIREAKAAKIRAEQLKEVRPPVKQLDFSHSFRLWCLQGRMCRHAIANVFCCVVPFESHCNA
jgi:hypothetical protein